MAIASSFRPSLHQWVTRASIVACASLGLALLPWSAQAKIVQLENLFVFGDSYSDAGNSGLLTKGIGPYLQGFPPPPYAGGRVSNGPVAVEQLWTLFNPSAPPLKPSLAGGTNYAVNGATSGKENQFLVNNSPEIVPVQSAFQNTSGYSQLNTFKTSAQIFQPAKTLFVFWLGGNDGLYWQLTQTSGLGSTPGTIQGDPPLTGQTAS